MMSKMTKKKKLILIRTDLLEKAAEICAKEGKTVFAFTNQVFENALKAYEMQTSLDELIRLYSLWRLKRNLGLESLPISLIDYMMEALYEKEREKLLARAFKSGEWLGKCLTVKLQQADIITTVENILSRLMWPSIDFSLERKTDNIELRYISPSSSQEKTEVASKFLIGMFDALGFTPNEHYSSPGLILIKFKRKQEEN